MPLKMILAAVVVAAAAVAVWFFGIRDGDDSSSQAGTDTTEAVDEAPTVTTLPLTDAGTELQDLLQSSRDGTFHATYTATNPPDTEGGQSTGYTVDLFRSGGRTRQDTTTHLSGGDYLTTGILADGKSIVCTKQGPQDWTCSQTDVDEGTESDGIFGQVLSELGGVDVTATDDTIDGQDVRCFAYTTSQGPGSMCLNADGIPVRITGGDTDLELTDLSDDVPDSTFDPPAEPVQAEAPSS
jgi:hypothetical protein